jgi:hypothetical protein
MNTQIKNAWTVNALLLCALLAAVLAKTGVGGRAHAAVAGGSANSVMLNSAEANERLVLVNTEKKQIMVYKIEGLGQFRLIAARSYEFDLTIRKDTAGSEIEKNGYSATQSAQKYLESTKK